MSEQYQAPKGSYQSNLNYQFSSDGSDSGRKLASIELPELAGKRFLDLGCNAGFFCIFARDAGAASVLGVDSSKKIIAVAREKSPDISFLDTGWDAFPEGEFDVVICLSAIHYAKDPVQLASNIHSHLAPDGLFVLEGGLWGAESELYSDILLPVWREVGDKCRHLSRGYVERHLLTSFEWTLLGRSINQGGDLLNRYAIHASPTEVGSRAPHHRVCFVEYANGLAISAPAISDQQPAYGYVRALGSTRKLGPEKIEEVLSPDAYFETFISDIAYAMAGQQDLESRLTMSARFLSRVQDALAARNIKMWW